LVGILLAVSIVVAANRSPDHPDLRRIALSMAIAALVSELFVVTSTYVVTRISARNRSRA